jgi:hypothetical protein
MGIGSAGDFVALVSLFAGVAGDSIGFWRFTARGFDRALQVILNERQTLRSTSFRNFVREFGCAATPLSQPSMVEIAARNTMNANLPIRR